MHLTTLPDVGFLWHWQVWHSI